MGFYVHISVVMPCNNKVAFANLATEYLAKESDWGGDSKRVARLFLEAAVAGNGWNCGPKGALFAWGVVGNYTQAEDFIDALHPFFRDCWKHEYRVEGDHTAIILDFEHIMVFCEPECSGMATAYEIVNDNVDLAREHRGQRNVSVIGRECEFAWGQH